QRGNRRLTMRERRGANPDCVEAFPIKELVDPVVDVRFSRSERGRPGTVDIAHSDGVDVVLPGPRRGMNGPGPARADEGDSQPLHSPTVLLGDPTLFTQGAASKSDRDTGAAKAGEARRRKRRRRRARPHSLYGRTPARALSLARAIGRRRRAAA